MSNVNPFSHFYQQIEEIKAKFVVCDSETEEEVKRAIQNLKDVCLLSIGRVGDSSIADLAALAAKTDESDAPLAAELEGSDPWEECAVVLWSSGTTGRPKGILHREILLCHMLTFYATSVRKANLYIACNRLSQIDVPMHCT